MPRIVTADPRAIDGGWALLGEQRARQLSYLPGLHDDREPAYASADAWEPPHPLALSPGLCDAILATVSRVDETPSGNGTYFLHALPDDLQAEVVSRAKRGNATWWQLVVDEWQIGLKRYRVGERHTAHQDLHAGAARRKLAGIVQLSDADDYEGGDLVIHAAGRTVAMPRARGTFVAFPGWAVHEVEPVTAGVRWSLCWNGWGPPLR